MTRRDWWLGIVLLTVALLTQAAVPRYTWQQSGTLVIRVDRWLGIAEVGSFVSDGRWASVADQIQFAEMARRP